MRWRSHSEPKEMFSVQTIRNAIFHHVKELHVNIAGIQRTCPFQGCVKNSAFSLASRATHTPSVNVYTRYTDLGSIQNDS